jgi:subtilisin family serine protease
MAGVAWNSLIMPVKVMDSDGNGSYLQIAAGIRYAADKGARIINLSVGGKNSSFILEDACKYAYDKDCVIIAASGNISSAVFYPAAYDNYCIAVGATDYNDEYAGFSNFGPSIDVAAPGVAVFGAVYNPKEPDNLKTYGWDSGTSYSAPFVSGAAAILLSYKPTLAVETIRALIMITADDVNKDSYPGVDKFIGYGRINLKRLLSPYELGK